jgi:hypothetical protein
MATKKQGMNKPNEDVEFSAVTEIEKKAVVELPAY